MKTIIKNIVLWAFQEDLKNSNNRLDNVEGWVSNLLDYLKLEIVFIEGSEGYYTIQKKKKLK